ncbi:MAG: hypothetical protein MK105_04750 [Crocinitomicaceae bacterium]|nr:hypothetical protein [Crocinitomicaceae bacterium]
MLYILSIVLLISFYQDLRFRGIQWFIFPLILIFSIFLKWETLSIGTLYNLLFIVLCLSGLTMYLSIKEGRIINITKGFFSWGDILILIALCPLFSLEGYILFFTVGTILTLVTFLIVNIWVKSKTVPYAGYMALFAMPTLFLEVNNSYLMLF